MTNIWQVFYGDKYVGVFDDYYKARYSVPRRSDRPLHANIHIVKKSVMDFEDIKNHCDAVDGDCSKCECNDICNRGGNANENNSRQTSEQTR